MPELSLALWGLFALLAVVGRAVLQLARTGSTGIRGVSGRPGSAEWLGGVLFVASLAVGVAAPVLDVAGALAPVEPLDGGGVQTAGIALYGVGLAIVLGAQLAMGASWRIGVDDSERTELVTGGPFALVRNPIYCGNIPTVAGLALLVPNVVALASAVLQLVALEIQVRLVEEPHLRRVHGEGYERYARRVGRFVPGLGRLG